MANAILTPTMVTREILRVLHEKATFIGTVLRTYDDSFAQKGAKIGDTLKIRLPNKYTVRTGKALSAQDTSEKSVSLTVATQKGVDMNFSTAELTMSLDDFSDRIIKPAVAVLVSNVENDFLQTSIKSVYNTVGTAGTTPADLNTPLLARARLNQMLAPKDDNRCIQYGSDAMAATVNGLKGLFHASTEIEEQYREGMMGRTAGYDWYENERIWSMVNGSDVTGTTDSTSLVTDGGTTIDMHTTIATSAQAVGSVFTIAGVYACHPETKAAYNFLQQFVITAVNSPATNQTTVSPTIYLTGPHQNVCKSDGTALATTDFNSQTLTFVGAASTSYPQHLAYHKEAFAFATADLEMPQGVHFAAREEFDGVSVRIVRAYDINNDNIPCRLDILYGYATLRAQLACRITG